MPSLDREAFRRRVARLDEETFVRFVAALWRGRGYETTVDGDVVTARRDGASVRVQPVGGRRADRSRIGRVSRRVDRLVRDVGVRRVDPRRRQPRDAAADSEADVVVFARARSGGPPADVRVVDVDDLYEMLLYALPRARADDVCRRFFDGPLVLPGPTDGNGDGEGSFALSSAVESARETGPVVAILVAGLVVASALLAGSGVVTNGGLGSDGVGDDLGAPAADASGVSGGGSTPTPAAPSASPGDSAPTSRPAGALNRSVDGVYPPGLGPAGVVDADRLARAHARAVTGQSYELTLVHREFVDDRPNGYRRERVSVASPTVYASSVESAGALTRPSLVVADVEAFSGGGVRYERRIAPNGSATYETTTVRTTRADVGRYADRVERYVRWFLSVEESRVRDSFRRDGVTYYWVVLGADPYPGVRNSSGSAIVSETGLVYGIHRRYEVPNSRNVTVSVSVRYDDVNSTRVTAPFWVDEARAATDGDAFADENRTATGDESDAGEATAGDGTQNATATTDEETEDGTETTGAGEETASVPDREATAAGED
jgi:hypothetical protein